MFCSCNSYHFADETEAQKILNIFFYDKISGKWWIFNLNAGIIRNVCEEFVIVKSTSFLSF